MRGRFDDRGFFMAVDGERKARGFTWRQVADETGVSQSSLSRMSKGHRPDVDTLAALTAWANLDANAFIRSGDTPRAAEPAAPSSIVAYLRRDPRLSTEAAATLADILTVTYSRLAQPVQRTKQ